MANNIPWLTITPAEPAGGYTEAENEITMTFSQNTTFKTRGGKLEFVNAIANEKHEYNPDTPDGQVEFFLYQFGKRELQISYSSDEMATPGTNDDPGVDFFTDQWDQTMYSDTGSATLDYTARNKTGTGIIVDRNVEGNMRSYTTGDGAVNFNTTLSVTSTSPWFIAEGAGWTGIPSAYYNSSRFSTSWKQPRTYAANGTNTPVDVTINISGNDGNTDRSTDLYVVNRQGYVQKIEITQVGYQAINIHPVATFTTPDAMCGGGSGTIVGECSDPEGHYPCTFTWGGAASGSGSNGSFTYPNASCTTGGEATATLMVTDSLGDPSEVRDIPIVSLPSGSNDCITPSCTITCPSMVSGGPNQAFTCNVSVSSSNGCPVSFAGSYNGLNKGGTLQPGFTQSELGGGNPITITGTLTSSNGNGTPKTFTCSSGPIMFGLPVGASIAFSGDGAKSVASGNVTATCSVNDPNGGTPMNFMMSGNCGGSPNVTSSTSSLTIPFSGLDPGDSQTCTASCSADSSGQSVSTTATTTVNRLNTANYNLSGVPVGYSCPAVPSQTGGNGAAYSFSDPTCSALSGYTCTGTAVFSGDSLTGNFAAGGGDVSVNRMLSGITCSSPDYRISGFRFAGGNYMFSTPNGILSGGAGTGIQVAPCMDFNYMEFSNPNLPYEITGGFSGGNKLHTCGPVSNCTSVPISTSFSSTSAIACTVPDSGVGTRYTDGGTINVGDQVWRGGTCNSAHIPSVSAGGFFTETQYSGTWNKAIDGGVSYAIQVGDGGQIISKEACPLSPTYTLTSNCCPSLSSDSNNFQYAATSCTTGGGAVQVSVSVDTGTFTVTPLGSGCTGLSGVSGLSNPSNSHTLIAWNNISGPPNNAFGQQCTQGYRMNHSNGGSTNIQVKFGRRDRNIAPCGGIANPCGTNSCLT